jgi:hypothetical protein
MTILRKRQESNGKVWFRVRRTWGETKRKETDVRDKSAGTHTHGHKKWKTTRSRVRSAR